MNEEYVIFYRGLKEKYDIDLHKDGIYFCTDTYEILMNGDGYGGSSITDFQLEGDTLTIYAGTKSYSVQLKEASTSEDGLLSSEDKLFIDGIRNGNLALPTPIITGEWTFYNNSDEEVESSDINPVPNMTNPQLEQGYKASFSGTYKWVHEEGKKDPTQVQSGSSWSDLPTSNVNSSIYTSPHLSSNSTIKIGIQAKKTGLMLSGSNIVQSSGYDTTIATRSVTFTTKRYFGTSTTKTVNESIIKSLTGELGGKSCTKTGVTTNNTQYLVYAYPSSLGDLSSIVQDGATPVLGAFTKSLVNVTNQAGLQIQYNVYVSNNLGAFTNVQLIFS